MKSKDLMMIIGGGIAAYMLFPQVKETAAAYLPGGGGSSGGGSTILDFFPEINLPSINISELPGVKEVIEVVKEAPDKIPDPTDFIPGGKDGAAPVDPLDIVDQVLDLLGVGGGGAPEIPNPFDAFDTAGSGLGLFGELKEIYERYVENFGKGVLGFADFGDFVTGGWQEDSGVMAWLRKQAFPVEALATGEVGGFLAGRGQKLIPETAGAKVVKPIREYATPSYTALSPTPHPGIPGISIVGVLRGSSTPIGSSGKNPPPVKAERWMFS